MGLHFLGFYRVKPLPLALAMTLFRKQNRNIEVIAPGTAAVANPDGFHCVALASARRGCGNGRGLLRKCSTMRLMSQAFSICGA